MTTPGSDDVVISIGVNMDPVAAGMKAAGPKIHGQAERFGETIAERVARGLTKQQAMIEKAADRVAAVFDRVAAKERFSKLSAREKMVDREFAAFDREVRRSEDKLARSQAAAVRERGRIVAAAERDAQQKRLEAIITTSDRINGIASLLPRNAARGTQFGAMLGRGAGPSGMAAAATVGGIGGLGVDAGMGVIDYAMKQVPLASNVEQSNLKFKEVFQEFSDTVRDEVDAFAKKVGRSKYQLRSSAADLGGMLTGMGIDDKTAAKMSGKLANLSVDLSSFHNIRQDDVMTKLMSGLAGELEPMRRLGPDLREVNVQSKALSMGLAATKNELTLADKVLARYQLILEGTTKAHGDAERSLNSYESSQRRYEASLEEFNIGIGRAAMPAMQGLNNQMNELLKSMTLTEKESEVLGMRLQEVVKNALQALDDATLGSAGATMNLAKDIRQEANLTSQVMDWEKEAAQADPTAFKDYQRAKNMRRQIARREQSATVHDLVLGDRIDKNKLQKVYDEENAGLGEGARRAMQRQGLYASTPEEAQAIAKRVEDDARRRLVMSIQKKRAGDQAEIARKKGLEGLAQGIAGLRDPSKDGAGMTMNGGQLSAAQQTKNNWDFLGSIGESIKSGIDAIGDDLAGKVRRGRLSRMSKSWGLGKKEKPGKPESIEPLGGGDHIAVDQLTRSIQSNLFRGVDEKRKRDAEEAAKKTATEAEKIAKSTEKTAARLDELPSKIAKFFGYGK